MGSLSGSAIALVALFLGISIVKSLIRSGIRKLRRGGRSKPSYLAFSDPYVIDGDTIALGDDRIRLFALDAPETDHPHGPAATRVLKELLGPPGTRLTAEIVSCDPYGRHVAKIFRDGNDVGRALVVSGYARAVPRYSRIYVKDEKYARKTREGLWAEGKIEDPAKWRRAG